SLAAGSGSDTRVLPSLPGLGPITASDGISSGTDTSLSNAGYDLTLAEVRGALVHSPLSIASASSFGPISKLELQAVPEPSTGLLLVSGLALLAAAGRRRSH